MLFCEELMPELPGSMFEVYFLRYIGGCIVNNFENLTKYFGTYIYHEKDYQFHI